MIFLQHWTSSTVSLSRCIKVVDMTQYIDSGCLSQAQRQREDLGHTRFIQKLIVMKELLVCMCVFCVCLWVCLCCCCVVVVCFVCVCVFVFCRYYQCCWCACTCTYEVEKRPGSNVKLSMPSVEHKNVSVVHLNQESLMLKTKWT